MNEEKNLVKEPKDPTYLGYLSANEINGLMEEIRPTSTQIRTRQEVYNLVSDSCSDCNGEVKYWDETDEEIIYQCTRCNKFYTIPYDPQSKTIYFSH